MFRVPLVLVAGILCELKAERPQEDLAALNGLGSHVRDTEALKPWGCPPGQHYGWIMSIDTRKQTSERVGWERGCVPDEKPHQIFQSEQHMPEHGSERFNEMFPPLNQVAQTASQMKTLESDRMHIEEVETDPLTPTDDEIITNAVALKDVNEKAEVEEIEANEEERENAAGETPADRTAAKEEEERQIKAVEEEPKVEEAPAADNRLERLETADVQPDQIESTITDDKVKYDFRKYLDGDRTNMHVEDAVFASTHNAKAALAKLTTDIDRLPSLLEQTNRNGSDAVQAAANLHEKGATTLRNLSSKEHQSFKNEEWRLTAGHAEVYDHVSRQSHANFGGAVFAKTSLHKQDGEVTEEAETAKDGPKEEAGADEDAATTVADKEPDH